MAGRWRNASPARGGCPWPPTPPSASPPRAPPRAGGDRGRDRPGRRADRPGQVQRPRVWGPLRQEERRVHAPSRLDARDPRSPGNRGRDASPRPPRAPAHAPSRLHAHPAPRPHACSPGPNRSSEGRVLESSLGTAARGAAGKRSGFPAALRPPPAAGSAGPRWGGRRGRPGSPRKSLEFCLLTGRVSQSSVPVIPRRTTQPLWRRLPSGRCLKGCLHLCFPPPRARSTSGHRAAAG